MDVGAIQKWASIWRQTGHGHGGAVIGQAERLGMRSECIAGLIFYSVSAPVLAVASTPAPEGNEATGEGNDPEAGAEATCVSSAKDLYNQFPPGF